MSSAALDQRVALRYALAPMTPAETADYVKHHLALAGRTDTLFSDDATTLIHQTSRGEADHQNHHGAQQNRPYTNGAADPEHTVGGR
jgi:type II secretory pathway predicted ATPase ExeA